MATLVSPGYSTSSLINSILVPIEERTIEFKGLNRKSSVDEGEMSDMKNLTSDNYPLLAPRKLRGELVLPEGIAEPLKIITKFERIAMIAKKDDDSVAFFYGDVEVVEEDGETKTIYNGSEVTSVTGLSENTEMVAINTKICFFPQKTYLSLVRGSSSVTIGEFGNLSAEIATTAEDPSWAVSITNEVTEVTVGSGHGFKYDDAIDITGHIAYKAAGSDLPIIKQLNVSCVVESITSTKLRLPRETFIELTGEGATNITICGVTNLDTGVHDAAKITRGMPDLKHVIEWNNRLWGASDEENTIFACKLGDPTNWQYYQGTSLDSYYAQQGTDENWTGSAAYSGHLIFFKPNSMTKIYGTSPSTFQVNNTVCYGVEAGSSKSVSIINDIVLYKSSIGIMAYEGGAPYLVSDNLNIKFKNVVGGTEGRKYYASIERADGENELLVLDSDRAAWHKEDDVRFRDCCTLDGRLYFIEDETAGIFDKDKVYIINPEEATEQKSEREWMAVFGPFDEYIENQKIYSKISLRFIAQPRTRVSIYIKMDDGEWEKIKEFAFAETGGETVPIVPRRCDRFSIKLVGRGDCEIKSLTRRCRSGSGVKIR